MMCRYKSKKKAFSRYSKKYSDGAKTIEEELNQLKKNCSVIRVLAHTQITKIGYGQKKAHMSEIQVFTGVLVASMESSRVAAFPVALSISVPSGCQLTAAWPLTIAYMRLSSLKCAGEPIIER